MLLFQAIFLWQCWLTCSGLSVLILHLQPQRCMIYVKDTFDQELYEVAYMTLWDYCFVRHIDISNPANMAKALNENFTKSQVVDILKAASTPKYKQALTEATRKVHEDLGGFGAPWIWVTNDKTGKSEPFFGSDRWAYIWDFLGVPHQDLKILENEQAKL